MTNPWHTTRRYPDAGHRQGGWPAKLRGVDGIRDVLDLGEEMKTAEPNATAKAMVDIEAQLNQPGMTEEQKRETIKRVRRKLLKERREIGKRRHDAQTEAAKCEREAAYLDTILQAGDKFSAWCAALPLRLERCDAPMLPALRHAADVGALISMQKEYALLAKMKAPLGSLLDIIDGAQSFVVQHDWAKAFDGAKDFEGASFRLPSDVCAFEFQINGLRIIAFALHTGDDGDSEIALTCIAGPTPAWFESGFIAVHQPSGWHARDETDDCAQMPLARFVGAQIKAVCVALDAEVATAEIVRALHLSNRPAKGVIARQPEYRVVTLSRRNRSAALPAGDPGAEPKHRKRLHFRRGHWRHYSTFKSWIKWTLVGDPDLGFIEKHYQL